MRHEGDVRRARRYFFESAPENLKSLLRGRYDWMNKFIGVEDRGLEIGCGTGLSREFIRSRHYALSDFADYEWLDHQGVDALATPFADASYDFVVCSNMIHHVAHPMRLFDEMERILKPGGRLIIQEVNGSFMLRLLLRIMRHEGYSYEPDVFDPDVVCNEHSDPWSANCVIPNLLFDDLAKFERQTPAFRVVYTSFSECLAMINSGGVIAKTACLPLPKWMLTVVRGVDAALTKLLPGVFALQRQIVLEKKAAGAAPQILKLDAVRSAAAQAMAPRHRKAA